MDSVGHSLDNVKRESYLRTGILRKKNRLSKKWTRYMLCLKASSLLYYKHISGSKRLKLKGEIQLRYITNVSYSANSGNSRFVLCIDERNKTVLKLRAKNEEECLSWMEDLKETIEAHLEARKELYLVSEDSCVKKRGTMPPKKKPRRRLAVKKVSEELQAKDFEKLMVIGEGSFSVVYLVKHISTGETYAMKSLNRDHVIETKHTQHVLAELSIMSRWSHPFLMKVHYAFQSKNSLNFILDFVNGGELFKHLEMLNYFDEKRAAFYAAEIVLALEFLHSMNIVYRDLKPENVLLTAKGHIMLIDFGLSKILVEDFTNSFEGTPEYMSPEVILCENYSFYIDWWSFGTLLYEMLTGEPPFSSISQRELYEEILYDNVIFPYTPDLSTPSKNLIQHLTRKFLEDRLVDPTEIKSHPFFAEIDWEAMKKLEIEPPFIPSLTSPTDTQYIDSSFLGISISSHSLSTYERKSDDIFDDFFYVGL